jgi:hypothetical protein
VALDERVIRDFFLGKTDAAALAQEAIAAIEHIDETNQVVRVRDLSAPFPLTREMLVRLCDAVLEGSFPADALVPIGFVLETSDRFEWENDDVIGHVLNSWSSPEIHYPLSRENIEAFKRWLREVEPFRNWGQLPQTNLGDISCL